MKVAVSAIEPTLDSPVDERFGRAMHFLIVEPSTMEFEAIDNSENRNAMQGAGIASAELVAGRGVGAVITGHLGPKAFRALSAAGIAGYDGARMTVREAIEAYAAGRLACLGEDTSKGRHS